MKTPKEHVRDMLDNIPDDATYDEIQYRLHLCDKIQNALDADSEGKTLTHTEMKQQMSLR